MGFFASFFAHVEELRARFVKCVAAFIAAFLVAFTCGLRSFQLFGLTLVYPYPDPAASMTILVFQKWRQDLLPADVTLLNAGVADTLIVQMQIGMFIAVVLASPVIFYQAAKFLAPALYKHEKTMAIKALAPAIGLFAAGMTFSYTLILPFTLDFMFDYTTAMGVSKTVLVAEFVNFVFLFLLAFGFVFEIPLVMVGLTRLGVVQPATWKGGWRYAVVGSLVFGALITPDGSGLTEVIVAVPMCALYGLGTGLSYVVARQVRVAQTAEAGRGAQARKAGTATGAKSFRKGRVARRSAAVGPRGTSRGASGSVADAP